MKPILVTCYVDPDLDGVAGAVAYSEFLNKNGKQAVAGIIGEPHDEAKYVLDRFAIPYPLRLQNADGYDEIVLVDASDLNGLEGKIDPKKIVEIIDHRKFHELKAFPNAQAQIELVGAAATLVAERFMQSGTAISKESAILVLAAIISNTLNFKGTVTTDRDRDAAAWLNETAQLDKNFWKEMFEAKSDLSGQKLAERIKSDYASFDINGKKVNIAQLEIIGGKKLLDERKPEILEILDQIKRQSVLDIIFLNLIELEEGKNYLVAEGPETRQLLEKTLDVRFDGDVAVRDELIMRKQIVPLLKAELTAG